MGCADRSAFDLSRHSEATGVDLVAQEELKEPVCVCLLAFVMCEVVRNTARSCFRLSLMLLRQSR